MIVEKKSINKKKKITYRLRVGVRSKIDSKEKKLIKKLKTT